MIETLKRIIGIEEFAYDGDGYEEYPGEEDIDSDYSQSAPESQPPEQIITPPDYRGKRRKSPEKQVETMNPNSKVVGMPGLNNGNAEVIVIEPHSFEEMPQVIQALRERKSVVLNLNMMNPEEAQRAVDFVAGGTYAMDGHQERVGESIFLFTPSCVKVSTLSGILHDVDEFTDSRVRRPIMGKSDPWQEQRAMGQ